MFEAVITIFVGACLLAFGGLLAYAADHEHVPRWMKLWTGLTGRAKYDTSEEAARVLPLVVGVVAAMFGLGALILGVVLLAGGG
jgi:hypothetical protein